MAIARQLGFCLLASVVLAGHAHGQADVTFDIMWKANRHIDQAIDAAGGATALSNVEDITFARMRTFRNPGQGHSPGEQNFAEGTINGVLDLRNRRGAVETRFPTSIGMVIHSRTVLDADAGTGFNVDLASDGNGSISRLGTAAVASAWQVWIRYLPPILLQEVSGARTNLRYLGTRDLGDLEHHIIAWTDPVGSPLTLFVSADDYSLARVEIVVSDPLLGDVVVAVSYSEYRPVGDVVVPSRATITHNGELIDDSHYVDIRINAGVSEELLSPPDGFTESSPTGPEPALQRVEDGVFLVNASTSHRSLLVEMDDHLVVIEAPMNDATGRQILDLARQEFPEKEVRYVVVTHHHTDHIGGLRPFMASGVTILTTPGNVQYIRNIGQTRRTASPDPMTDDVRNPHVEVIAGRRALGNGTRSVHLIPIGPLQHAEEMLVAYIPSARALFQGDALFVRTGNGRRGVFASPDARSLADAIAQHQLDVRVIYGVHGSPATPEDLNRVSSSSEVGWLYYVDDSTH